jgi:hypothetical protein
MSWISEQGHGSSSEFFVFHVEGSSRHILLYDVSQIKSQIESIASSHSDDIKTEGSLQYPSVRSAFLIKLPNCEELPSKYRKRGSGGVSSPDHPAVSRPAAAVSRKGDILGGSALLVLVLGVDIRQKWNDSGLGNRKLLLYI